MHHELRRAPTRSSSSSTRRSRTHPHFLEHAFGPDSGAFAAPITDRARRRRTSRSSGRRQTADAADERYKVPVSSDTLDVAQARSDRLLRRTVGRQAQPDLHRLPRERSDQRQFHGVAVAVRAADRRHRPHLDPPATDPPARRRSAASPPPRPPARSSPARPSCRFAGSPARPSASREPAIRASAWPTPADGTSSRASARRSTRCSARSRTRSRRNAASSPTPRTSCARR